MAGAGVDVAVRIERDLALGMAPEPDPAVRRKLLALAPSTARDVVDHDPHGGTVTPPGVNGLRPTTR